MRDSQARPRVRGKRDKKPDSSCACTVEEEHALNAAIRQAGDATIVDVTGDIDLNSSAALRKLAIENLRHAPRVILNLQQVRYVDSSGIASLVEVFKESQALHNRFILFGLSKAARDVLKLTHLLNVFEVYETEKQALEA